MRRKLLAVILVLVLTVSLAAPVFAAAPGTFEQSIQEEYYSQLRGIVVKQTSDVSNLIVGILPADLIKSIAKEAISGMLDLGSVGDMAGPALSGLIGGAIENNLGVSLPGSIDLGGIINDVLKNDMVNTFFTSVFVNKVIDRTIDNLIDSIDLNDVIGVLSDSVVDKLTEEIWNNGNPISATIPIIGTQIGVWNNTSNSWNETNIAIIIAAKLGVSTAGLGSNTVVNAILNLFGITVGDIEDYVDVSAIDYTRIFSANTIINALQKAVTVTATEYYNAYKPILIAKVQARIDELKDKAKADLVSELNKIFELKLSALNDFNAIEASITAYIRDSKNYVAANRSEIVSNLKDLKKIVNKADKYSCLDLNKVNALLGRLIKCLEKEIVITDPDPALVSVNPSAVVEKLNGNKNNLKITIFGTYSNGTTKIIAEKTFSISNNAADTYEVAGYKVYVDTKGNVQIRACYIVSL